MSQGPPSPSTEQPLGPVDPMRNSSADGPAMRRAPLSPGRLRGVRGLLLALLVLATLVGILHREVLFSRAVYHMDDAADGYYPSRVAYLRALREGTLPSWEPNASGGWPLVADPYYGYFYPLNFVFYLGPRAGEPDGGLASGIPSGLGYSVALHALLAGVGMFLFLSRRSAGPGRTPLPFFASLLGAISFALSSFLVVRVRHVIFVQMMAWLPFLMAAIDDYVATRRRRSLALCALFTGLLLLSGAHSILHFAALLLAAYAGAALASSSLGQPRGQRLRFAFTVGGALLFAALLGALLGAVALAPTLSAMPHTTRALGTDYKFASSYAWPGLRYLQLLLLPDAMGIGENRQQPFLSPWNHWELAGYYQGALALLLALPGVGTLLRRRGPVDLERIVLFGCAVAGVLIALGDAGPLHPILFRYLPLYAALRCPSRGLIMVVVAVPILAAYGAQRCLGSPAPQPPGTAAPRSPLLRRSTALAVALAITLFGCAFALATRALHMASAASGSHAWVLRAVAHVLPLLGALGALLALARVARLRGALPLAILCLLTSYDQLTIDRGYIQPQPLDYPYGMERFHAVEWLLGRQAAAVAAHHPPASAAAPDPDPVPFRFAPDPRGPFRLMAIGQTLGLESASGYSSVQVWRYRQLLYILRHGRPYPHRKQLDDLAAASVWNFDSPLVDMLNIRYVIGAEPPSPRWRQVFAPTPGSAPHARYEPGWDSQLRVYENPRVLPRAWVAYRARLAPDEAGEAALVAARDFDPHREVIVGPIPRAARRATDASPAPWPPRLAPAAAPGVGPGDLDGAVDPARVTRHDRHHVVVEASARSDGMLVLADAYYPGWSATVDGVPQPLYPVNLALRGVPLSPGAHRIEFHFDPRPVRFGARLTVCGLLLLAVLALLPWPLRRRRRA